MWTSSQPKQEALSASPRLHAAFVTWRGFAPFPASVVGAVVIPTATSFLDLSPASTLSFRSCDLQPNTLLVVEFSLVKPLPGLPNRVPWFPPRMSASSPLTSHSERLFSFFPLPVDHFALIIGFAARRIVVACPWGPSAVGDGSLRGKVISCGSSF